MAYNIIKGRVEFSNSSTGSIESLVDIWRNQSIGGTKTFTSNITASGYWDSTRNQKLERSKNRGSSSRVWPILKNRRPSRLHR